MKNKNKCDFGQFLKYFVKRNHELIKILTLTLNALSEDVFCSSACLKRLVLINCVCYHSLLITLYQVNLSIY